jgi:uncharacterized membrane protein YcaP (DUF421 family)
MENIINNIWGDGEHLNALQMSIRAFVMFIIALIFIRLGGLRLFSKKSAFFSTVAASAIMILIHRLLAFIAVKSDRLCIILKGDHILLFKDGKILWENMKKATISKNDLMESLRLETQQTSLDEIEMAYLETNGRISFITKKSK